MLNNFNLQIKPYRESDMIYALRKCPNMHLWSGYFLRSVWKIEHSRNMQSPGDSIRRER